MRRQQVTQTQRCMINTLSIAIRCLKVCTQFTGTKVTNGQRSPFTTTSNQKQGTASVDGNWRRDLLKTSLHPWQVDLQEQLHPSPKWVADVVTTLSTGTNNAHNSKLVQILQPLEISRWLILFDNYRPSVWINSLICLRMCRTTIRRRSLLTKQRRSTQQLSSTRKDHPPTVQWIQ